jgi:hypothetical protein
VNFFHLSRPKQEFPQFLLFRFRSRMTTEQLGQLAIEAPEKMSARGEAEVRQQLERQLQRSKLWETPAEQLSMH